MEGVASAGVLDVSRADGILANTAAPTVCITSDLPVIRSKSVSRFGCERKRLRSPVMTLRDYGIM